MGRHYTRLHRTTWYVYNSCDYKCSGDPFHRPAKTQLSCRTHLFHNLPLSSRLLGDRDASYVNNFQNAVTQQCLDRQSSPLTCRYVAQPIYLHRSQSSIAVLWVQDQKLSRHRETARFCVHSIFYVSVSLDWPKAECSRPVRPSVRPFILLLPTLCTLYVENECTDFAANWYKWSTVQIDEKFNFWGRRSKVKVTPRRSQIWRPGDGIIVDPLRCGRVGFLVLC